MFYQLKAIVFKKTFFLILTKYYSRYFTGSFSIVYSFNFKGNSTFTIKVLNFNYFD